jgi:peptidoglycan/xylan/chitin deacetylase (PgdA/CDA1 family)
MSVWPNGARCAVMLTFDFDAEAGWLSRDPDVARRPGVLSQGTYGAKVAVPRILTLLEQERVRATFFIPGWVAEHHPAEARAIRDAGHEIGHHGYLHVSPGTQTEDEERAALEKGIEVLRALAGEAPLGYRSPSWDLSAHSLRLLADHGFLYDSSLMAWDAPYLVPVGDGRRDLVEIPISWELDDAPYFLFAFRPAYRVGLADPARVFRIWRAEFDAAYAEGGTVCYTMHPQIIGRQHRLWMLERLIQHVRRFPAARFARAVDVARAYRVGGQS